MIPIHHRCRDARMGEATSTMLPTLQHVPKNYDLGSCITGCICWCRAYDSTWHAAVLTKIITMVVRETPLYLYCQLQTRCISIQDKGSPETISHFLVSWFSRNNKWLVMYTHKMLVFGHQPSIRCCKGLWTPSWTTNRCSWDLWLCFRARCSDLYTNVDLKASQFSERDTSIPYVK